MRRDLIRQGNSVQHNHIWQQGVIENLNSALTEARLSVQAREGKGTDYGGFFYGRHGFCTLECRHSVINQDNAGRVLQRAEDIVRFDVAMNYSMLLEMP